MENPYKEEFRAIFQQHVTRRGGDQLLEWLENTDFLHRPCQYEIPLRLRVRPGDAQPECLQGAAGKVL